MTTPEKDVKKNEKPEIDERINERNQFIEEIADSINPVDEDEQAAAAEEEARVAALEAEAAEAEAKAKGTATPPEKQPPTDPPEQTPEVKKVTLKVYGQDEEVDEKDVLEAGGGDLEAGKRILQKEKALDRRFAEQAEKEKALDARLKALETQPPGGQPDPPGADQEQVATELTQEAKSQIVKDLQFGDEEKGLAAIDAILKAASSKPGAPQLSTANLVQELKFDLVNDEFDTLINTPVDKGGYADFKDDPHKKALAGSFFNEARKAGEAYTIGLYRTAMDKTRKAMGEGKKEEYTIDPALEAKKEKKAAVKTPPGGEGVKPGGAEEEGKAPTVSETIEEMASSRPTSLM